MPAVEPGAKSKRQSLPVTGHAEPFDFTKSSVASASNDRLKRAVQNAVVKNDLGRQTRLLELPDSGKLRSLAGQIKQHTLDHLDYYLATLQGAVEARGGHVHFARTGEDATRIILQIARDANVKSIIKSKSMVSEEIELAHVFEREGFDVVETDLGEFIVQIDHDKPSHIVTPIIHKDRQSIAELFSRYFGTPYNDDPNALTAQARVYLREKFRRADMGMTGGNFIVAETGEVCTVENEGNARQSVTSPRVLVSLVGIEKLVPTLEHLAVMLKLLARSATGQPMTVYTSLFGSPRTDNDLDGPQEFHLVLMDNGRSEILASEEYRETLRCIRCGACLNACPIYRSIGGHSYGSVYPGPIGALITPLMQGTKEFGDLPKASSLCGACYDACPVKINIPKHLINLRRDMVKRHGPKGWIEDFMYRVWSRAYDYQFTYELMTKMQKWFMRLTSRNGYVKSLPPPGNGWTNVRDIPAPASSTFREMWKKSGRN
ncbi:MAG: LutB/LldF family L-lactate oxidation iron-sulfur protein [Tepidisphaeraceae bacterium]